MLARGLALATVLLGLALTAGRPPALHAASIPLGPIVCTLCPQLPRSPSLDPLQVAAGGNAVMVHGQGFSTWGGVDLYVWQNSDPSGLDAGAFAGTLHTTARGTALTFDLSPLVYTGNRDRSILCLGDRTVYVVAIDDKTALSSGVQALDLGCYALQLPAGAARSLHATLHAMTGAVAIKGTHYTPDTAVAVYLLPNGQPRLASFPTTLTARGTRFTVTLPTGHTGCSDTLSWTTFALDQAANVASPLRTVQDRCTSITPPK
jgi:hypothetical protein